MNGRGGGGRGFETKCISHELRDISYHRVGVDTSRKKKKGRGSREGLSSFINIQR